MAISPGQKPLHREHIRGENVSLNISVKLYGVKSDNIDWFNSYLQGRAQYVSIGGISSSILSVLCGVVQGSILRDQI